MTPLDKVTRQELYDLAWSQSMATLAPEYGLSDVALKKRCKNLGIPTPPRGYWAKLEAGIKQRKPPLPETWSITKRKKRVPKSAEEVDKLPLPERDYSIDKPTKLIRTTRQDARRTGAGHDGLIHTLGDGILRMRISRVSLDRGLWLWQKLIDLLPSQGLKMEHGSSSVTDGTESVWLELKEMLGKYEAVPRKSDRQTYSWLPRPTVASLETYWIPNGVLTFRCEAAWSGCSDRWCETELRRLEDRLEDVVLGLSTALKRKHEVQLEREERSRRYEEEREARIEAEVRQRHEDARCRKLVRLAQSLDRADNIRNLCSRIEFTASMAQRAQAAPFLEWALDYAAAIDPVSVVLRDLGQEVDPALPEHEDRYPRDERGFLR